MNIVIAGYGVEGQASYHYWRSLGHEVAIADQRTAIDDAPDEAQLILGPEAFDQIGSFDKIIRSPGVAPRLLSSYPGKVWSATNQFFEVCPCPIVGVTGTKGKGTVSSMIASILDAAGKPNYLVGNIGLPALSELPKITTDDVVVFELSSFQLWDVERSPHIAVMLAVESDHLDVHDSFDDYLGAKANIAKYQTADDYIIYNQDNQPASQIASNSPGQKIIYPSDISQFEGAIKLPGRHNVENASAAIEVARLLGCDDDAIWAGLSKFEGLPHRLKFVGDIAGVQFYDDSIATTPGSAIAAMDSFAAPKLLILGGSSKGASYDDVVAHAKATDTQVLAIGETGAEIYDLCKQAGVRVEREMGLMDQVVARALDMATEGDVVILSPASASFDQYANYKERGEEFIRAVESQR